MINLFESSSKRLRINDLGGHSDISPGTPGTSSTPSTPSNVNSYDTPTTEVCGIIRPMGRKAANRKAKAVAEDLMVEVMIKELSIL